MTSRTITACMETSACSLSPIRSDLYFGFGKDGKMMRIIISLLVLVMLSATCAGMAAPGQTTVIVKSV